MKARGMVGLVVAVLIPLLVGALGSVATSSAIPSWYQRLEKPSWNPPNWLFGPAWTVLYVLMGVASWLVWRSDRKRGVVRVGLGLYGFQLALNLLWTVIFFGWRKPGAAFVEIFVLAGAIVATMTMFFRVKPIAGWLLVPYLLWVSFASTLNGAIWQLNRE